MIINRSRTGLLVLFSFFAITSLALAQSSLSLKEILEKNIQAAGGAEKILQVKNYSFKTGQTTFYLNSEGLMKLTTGKDPIITEVILVSQEAVKRNSFGQITEISGPDKAIHQCLARLRSGFFTLMNFKGQLIFQGLKSYGPENLYQLTTKIGDLKVDFFLQAEEFTMKRIAFHGVGLDGQKYEINHDYGPFQEVEGLKLPSSWFSSQVGTRGILYEASDIRINQPLEKEFFSSLEINAGKVEVTESSLKGNVIDFMPRDSNLVTISTNWTRQDIEKAGIKNNDQLTLEIDSLVLDLIFYDQIPQRNALGSGAKLIFPNPQGENYIIFLSIPSSELTPIVEKLKTTLLSIQIKKK